MNNRGTGNGSPQSVIRFDASGKPTSDTWTSAAASSSGASSLTNLELALLLTPSLPLQPARRQTAMFSSGIAMDWASSPWARAGKRRFEFSTSVDSSASLQGGRSKRE